MNAYLKPIAAVAAVIVLAVVGYNLLPGTSGGIGGPAPTVSPAPTPTPTPTPGAQEMPGGVLAAGTCWTRPYLPVSGTTATLWVPAGWQGVPRWALVGPDGTDVPGGIGVVFLKVDGVFRDPCRWDVDGTGSETQPGDIVVGPTVDDLVMALCANTSYTTSAPVPATVGGYSGQRLDVHMPTDLDPTTCDVSISNGVADPTGH